MSEEDARCRQVFPTEKALAIYPQLREAYDAFYEGLLESLSPEDREAVARLSEILYQNAKKMV